MRFLAKQYKTYQGAMKRAAFERAHGKPDARVVEFKRDTFTRLIIHYQVGYGKAKEERQCS